MSEDAPFFSAPLPSMWAQSVLIVECQRCMALVRIGRASAHRDWHSRVDSGAVT